MFLTGETVRFIAIVIFKSKQNILTIYSSIIKQQNNQLKYNIANLLNRDILAWWFDATIGGKFQDLAELGESSDINEEWAKITTTVKKVQQNILDIGEVNNMSWSSLNQETS